MKRLVANTHILHVLKSCNPKIRNAIINHAHPEVIKTLCEIAINTLNGNNPITRGTKTRLACHKKSLRKLSNIKLSIPTKRRVLIQSGGGLIPILIGSVLSGILGRILKASE